jgi:uncharacterized membrane protein
MLQFAADKLVKMERQHAEERSKTARELDKVLMMMMMMIMVALLISITVHYNLLLWCECALIVCAYTHYHFVIFVSLLTTH